MPTDRSETAALYDPELTTGEVVRSLATGREYVVRDGSPSSRLVVCTDRDDPNSWRVVDVRHLVRVVGST